MLACLLVLGLGLVGPADAWAKPKKKASAKIAPLTADGLPNVQAATSFVLDTKSGSPVYSKAADEVRPIASTGKIFVAMLVRKRGIALDGVTEITDSDKKAASGGARTRLPVGAKYKNVDLLHAMLVASDNRAPTALARAVGLEPKAMVAALNALAKDMGLKKTKFTDPTGLRGNESTAREMAMALIEARKDPVLAEIMATKEVTIHSVAAKPKAITYFNTNVSLRTQKYEVLGGKTGFTTAAGYCLVTMVKVGEKELAMAFLGAVGELTRFADMNRVCGWLDAKADQPATAAKTNPSPTGNAQTATPVAPAPQ